MDRKLQRFNRTKKRAGNLTHTLRVKLPNTKRIHTFSSGQYKASQLKRWRPAPVVSEHFGQPGEMGKPVRTPPEQEAEMKERFKVNQFNIMASDIISLNRSLADVRLAG